MESRSSKLQSDLDTFNDVSPDRADTAVEESARDQPSPPDEEGQEVQGLSDDPHISVWTGAVLALGVLLLVLLLLLVVQNTVVFRVNLLAWDIGMPLVLVILFALGAGGIFGAALSRRLRR